MLTLAAVLFLLSILIIFFAGLMLAAKLAVFVLIAYAIYKLVEWLFD